MGQVLVSKKKPTRKEMSKAKFEQTKTIRLRQTLTSKLNNSNNNNNHNNNNEETVDSFSLIPSSTPISTPIEAPTETQAVDSTGVDSTEVDSTEVSKGLADSLTQAQNQIGLCLQKQRQVSFILREVKDILKR